MKSLIYPLFVKKLEILFLLMLVSVSVAFGEESSHIQKAFEEAELHYQEGDFQKAIEIYEEILSGRRVSVSLYYNLGNAYFKFGDIGRAILNYERARKLSPEDKELKHNLSFVRDLLQDKVEVLESPRWLQRITRLHRLLPLTSVVIIGSLCYSLILLFASYAVVRPRFRTTFLRVILFPLACVFVFSIAIGGIKILEPQFLPAIVIAEEVDVHYGPSIHETKAFVLHAGTKCSVREVSGEWMLIWLPNDKGGWVHQSGLERI